MKASEARRISEFGKEVDQETLKEAYMIIECKASVGGYAADISYNTRTRTIIPQLKEDGYSVKVEHHRNCPVIIISWKLSTLTPQHNEQ